MWGRLWASGPLSWPRPACPPPQASGRLPPGSPGRLWHLQLIYPEASKSKAGTREPGLARGLNPTSWEPLIQFTPPLHSPGRAAAQATCGSWCVIVPAPSRAREPRLGAGRQIGGAALSDSE